MAVAAPEIGIDRPYQKGIAAVVLAACCWSVMGIGVRLMESATAAQILMYRSLALAPCLFLVISLRTNGHPIQAIHAAGLPAVFGGIALIFAFGGGIAAIQMTTVANALFLFASAPFFGALLGWLILREHVRPATWIAMVVGLGGIAMMVGEGLALGYIVGNALAVLSALGFAVFTIALRWRQSADMLPVVLLGSLFSLASAATFCLTSGMGFVIPLKDLLLCFGLGIFQLGLGLTLYTYGARSVPAAELTLLSLVEVILGIVWVWLVFGEGASFYTMVGGFILFTAIVGNALSGLKRRPAPMTMR